VTKKEAGKRIFGLMIGGKKGVHFFGKGYCEKCTGMKQQRKRRAKKIYCKIKMPIIFIKGSCVETPLYTMCWINEDGDKGQV
jgi:hypothetical protein